MTRYEKRISKAVLLFILIAILLMCFIESPLKTLGFFIFIVFPVLIMQFLSKVD